MKMEERYFKRYGDEIFVYTAHITDKRQTWFVQARVDVVDALRDKLKVKKFDCKLVAPDSVRPADKVTIEHKCQIIDLILKQVRELAKYQRPISKYPFNVELEGVS
jgi:hypothetical protein